MSDRADSRERSRGGDHPAWLLALAPLLAWQAWLTLGLFGPDRPWERLLDDQPVVSGRHPLHLYHGFLGARTLWERGTLSCYDPAFHAGYPKTPVFDGGSRPAELALALAGARYCPAAYKVGHALLCLLAPLLLFTAARGVGMTRACACLACALGLLIWWGRPCREALAAGDVDLLLATLFVLAQAGLLVRYHHAPGPLSLLGVVLTGFLGWFAHPLLLALLLPLFLVYYLSAGTRHHLAWHLCLLGGLLTSVAANAFWLVDWVSYWWIRLPPRVDTPLLTHRTLRTLWEAPLWGGPVDKVLALALAFTAGAGVLLYNESGRRTTARLLGLGWVSFLALAVLGIAWEPVARFGTAGLIVPALLFATLPAAHALSEGMRLLRRLTRSSLAPFGVALALPALAWLLAPPAVGDWARHLAVPEPLEVGLGASRQEVVDALTRHTTDQARILWEDHRGTRLDSHWTALLPLLIGRAFVGGLDPEAGIEHATCGLSDDVLAGRPLREWADSELADYCRRYNVGWVACRSPEAQRRFRAWSAAEPVASLPGEPEGRLFRVKRDPSFALVGKVRWRSADARRILLADVEPRPPGPGEGEGQIVLSLHYQAGMRVTPGRVRLERALGPDDAIPFVRLRVAEPVGRVMITWEGR
jgi:hypothetical protein